MSFFPRKTKTISNLHNLEKGTFLKVPVERFLTRPKLEKILNVSSNLCQIMMIILIIIINNRIHNRDKLKMFVFVVSSLAIGLENVL